MAHKTSIFNAGKDGDKGNKLVSGYTGDGSSTHAGHRIKGWAGTFECSVCKRKRLVRQMCDSLRDELRYDHCQEEWKPLALLKRPDDNWNGLEASLSALDARDA